MEHTRLLWHAPPAPAEPTNEERIRDAALRSFASHGIAATSLRTVAEAAGVSIGLLQHYFGTKAGLIAAVDQYVLHLVSDALEAQPLPAAPADSLTEAGRRITNLFAEHPDAVDYLGRALVEGDAVGKVIFDGLYGISAAQRDHFAEQQLARPDLDPIWAALNPLLLRFGAVIFRTHIERYLPEPLFTPAQLQRWNAAVTTLIREGQMRDQSPADGTSAPSVRPTKN